MAPEGEAYMICYTGRISYYLTTWMSHTHLEEHM
jgi:hypothetical protein